MRLSPQSCRGSPPKVMRTHLGDIAQPTLRFGHFETAAQCLHFAFDVLARAMPTAVQIFSRTITSQRVLLGLQRERRSGGVQQDRSGQSCAPWDLIHKITYRRYPTLYAIVAYA